MRLFRVKASETRRLDETNVQSDSDDHVSADAENPVVDDRFTHLSAFALNGRDGAVRWHHLAGDFEQSRVEVSTISTETMKSCCSFVFYRLPATSSRSQRSPAGSLL